MVVAYLTEVIFSASSLEISKPKFSSIATTSSTPSKLSNPMSSKVASLVSFSILHLEADFRIWKTLASTSSKIYVLTWSVVAVNFFSTWMCKDLNWIYCDFWLRLFETAEKGTDTLWENWENWQPETLNTCLIRNWDKRLFMRETRGWRIN